MLVSYLALQALVPNQKLELLQCYIVGTEAVRTDEEEKVRPNAAAATSNGGAPMANSVIDLIEVLEATFYGGSFPDGSTAMVSPTYSSAAMVSSTSWSRKRMRKTIPSILHFFN